MLLDWHWRNPYTPFDFIDSPTLHANKSNKMFSVWILQAWNETHKVLFAVEWRAKRQNCKTLFHPSHTYNILHSVYNPLIAYPNHTDLIFSAAGTIYSIITYIHFNKIAAKWWLMLTRWRVLRHFLKRWNAIE